MGFWERRREHHAEQERLKLERGELAVHDAWQEQVNLLRDSLDIARTYQGEQPDGMSVDGILLKPGERAYAVLNGAALIEPRRMPGHYQGGSQGVSLHIAKGVNYRVGRMRGTFVPGPEESMPIDVGVVMISDRRVVFAGPKQTREWLYDKLIGYSHADGQAATTLQVSNRQKASGFGYDVAHAANIQFRFDLALATHRGTREQIVRELQARLDELVAKEPALPVAPQPTTVDVANSELPEARVPELNAASVSDPSPAPAPAPTLPPAGWYPDPKGSTQRRYWDGGAWTDQVAP